MDKKEIAQVRIYRDCLYKRVFTRPLKYYGRMGGFTFGLVFLTNILTTFFDNDRRQFMTEHPQMYFGGLLFKGGYFGILWPSFYFTAVTNPRSAFVYGAGLEKAANEFEKLVDEIE